MVYRFNHKAWQYNGSSPLHNKSHAFQFWCHIIWVIRHPFMTKLYFPKALRNQRTQLGRLVNASNG